MKAVVKNEKVILGVILLLGLIVRLYRLDFPLADWHSWRQADTASVSRIYVEELKNTGSLNLLYPRYYDISTAQSGIFNPNGYRFVEFPIYNAAHAVLTYVFPFWTLEMWGRLLSIHCALGTALGLYFLGKWTAGKWVGLLSALFYLLIPFNIFFTRVVLPEPAATLFAVWALVFFFQFTSIKKDMFLYIGAFSYAIALLIKPYVIFYGVPMLIILLNEHGFKKIFKIKKYWYALAIAFIPLLLWRAWISQYPEGIPFWKWAFNGDEIRFRPAFWRWIFGERIGKMILGIWGLIPFSFGILASTKKKILIPGLLSGMLLYVVVVATANVKHDYYQTLLIPSIALTLAYGSATLWNNKTFSKFVSRGLLLFSLLLGLGSSAYQIRDFYLVIHPEIILAGEAVDKIVPKDALVIAPYNGDTAFLYQTRRFGWPVIDRPLPQLIDKGARYYVSVNYDDVTNKIMTEYEIVEKNEKFVIVKLK